MHFPIAVLFLSFIVGYSTDYPTKTLDCNDPNGYGVVEVRESNANYVKIVRGDKVFETIKLPTEIERNGFAVNWAKKTKAGFEISVEYGSRYYYEKRFNFICKQHKFYLSKIIVTSFDKADPEKWNTKVVRIKPNLPLEKFSINDFMLEGVVK